MLQALLGNKIATFVVGIVIVAAIWKATNGDLSQVATWFTNFVDAASDQVLKIWHTIFS